MPKKKTYTDADDALLAELGALPEVAEEREYTAEEERILAGFEEIETFYEKDSRKPLHGEDRDIFERLYAVRLDQIKKNENARKLLKARDRFGLLNRDSESEVSPELDDDALLAALEGDENKDSLTALTHVRSHAEKKIAEEIAQRTPCKNFETFEPIFASAQADLENGGRKALPIEEVNFRGINEGDLFILGGQIAFVAEKDEEFINDSGRPDNRLRIIYDNRTESEPLLRSLQKALQQDDTSKRISKIDHGPLFGNTLGDDDISSGTIYVLRSKSDHPFIAENRNLIHKIGVTTSSLKKRLANVKKDPTFLFADVEVVASYQLANLKASCLEALLHKFFEGAQLDLTFDDPLRGKIQPREWFLVPKKVIEETIKILLEGELENYSFDLEVLQLVRKSDASSG